MQAAGQIPNYEASMVKMFGSGALQRLQQNGTEAIGLCSQIWDAESEHPPLGASFTQGYVWSVPMTIAGGTSEIQRSIIATRGLGLRRLARTPNGSWVPRAGDARPAGEHLEPPQRRRTAAAGGFSFSD